MFEIQPIQKPLKTARMAMMMDGMTRTASTSQIALRALAMIDPERVSGIPGIVGAYEAAAAAARNDRELSEIGKQERARAAADSRLAGLATVGKELAQLQAEHAAKRQQATASAVRPAADASETLVDLALAALVKAENPVPGFLELADVRTRQAVARLPAVLSGLKPEEHARIVGSLVSPELALELGEEAAALGNAKSLLEYGIADLQADAHWEPGELVKRFGTELKLPGVHDAGVRLAMEAAKTAQQGVESE